MLNERKQTHLGHLYLRLRDQQMCQGGLVLKPTPQIEPTSTTDGKILLGRQRNRYHW